MARTRLIGDFGKFATATIGADISTGLLVDGTEYLVKVVGSSSTLASGAEAGYLYTADGTEDITSSGDVVAEFTVTDSCDIQAWGMEFSSNSIDVTTLCDDQLVYEAGKADVTGSSEGTYTVGITDQDTGLARKFIDVVRQAGNGGTVSISKIDNDSIYAFLVKQKDKSSGETYSTYVVPIIFTSFSDGVTIGDRQTFSSEFRLSKDDYLTPHLYNNTIA